MSVHSPIGGNPSSGSGDLGVTSPIAHHELPANHLALLITNGLAIVVHFEAGNGLRRSGVAALGGHAMLLGRGGGFDQHVAAALGGCLLRVLVASFRHGSVWFVFGIREDYEEMKLMIIDPIVAHPHFMVPS